MTKKILLVANVAKEHVLKFHIPTIKEFSRRGWQVDVACAGEEEIPFCHQQFHMCWKRTPFTWKTIQGTRQLKTIIDSENYDVIYCHTPVGGIAARLAGRSARKNGTKVIYCAHGFHFFKGAPKRNWMLYYPAEKILARLTDVIFTVNHEDYETARQHFAKRTDVRLVPEVGVDFSRLQFGNKDEVRKQYRQNLMLPDDAFVMIYVAELIPNKNQTMLIDTLKILRGKGNNVFLLLPGPEHDDGALRRYAEEQGVLGYCRFLGWRSDIGQLMAAADICTASSIREGFGINLAEALYCGLPVVATNNRGHEMVIRNGKNGFLVPINDASAMAIRVERIMHDPVLRKSLADNDLQRFDCNVIAASLCDTIEGIVSKP